MLEDIIEQCVKLQIINDSDDILDFSAEAIENDDVKLGLHLVGKLLA